MINTLGRVAELERLLTGNKDGGGGVSRWLMVKTPHTISDVVQSQQSNMNTNQPFFLL